MAKKVLIILMIAVFIFPIAASAEFGFGISDKGMSFSLGFGDDGGYGGSGWNPGSLSRFGLPTGSVIGIIENILFWLLGILGLVGVIGFVISGILYLVSVGDEAGIERAKNAMKWSIVGVVVGLMGVVVIQAINLMLNQYSDF